MSSASIGAYGSYLLPQSVATKRNLSSLVNELERIDNELTAKSVHEGDDLPYPDVPEMVQDFLSLNEFSLDNSSDRSEMITQLRLLKRKAPVVHMSFAVEADALSLGKIVGWFRDSVHSQTIIVVGFQPALVAGAYIRTPNHIYDVSLRSAFKSGRTVLLDKIEELSHGNE